jgi:hypothetical protein
VQPRLLAPIASLLALAGAPATAVPVFDFATTSRQLVSTAPAAPTTADLTALPAGATPLFTVGNLFNGCGLWPAAPNANSIRTGTGCPQSDHDTTSPVENLSRKITYTDSFTISGPTQGVLEIIVKLGHPENAPAWKNQNQDERFDVYLVNGATSVLLARFLDDVDARNGLEDDAYYRYLYAPAALPIGTWSPVFQSVAGSVEFLTRLSALPSNQVPLPGTIWLVVLALAGAIGAARPPRGPRRTGNRAIRGRTCSHPVHSRCG